jgi:hypothetical protein
MRGNESFSRTGPAVSRRLPKRRPSSQSQRAVQTAAMSRREIVWVYAGREKHGASLATLDGFRCCPADEGARGHLVALALIEPLMCYTGPPCLPRS